MSNRQSNNSIIEWLRKYDPSSDAVHGYPDDLTHPFQLVACDSTRLSQPVAFDGFDSEMDDSENGSIATSRSTATVSTSISYRPTLVPTLPSTKRSTKGSRSPSPTRKLLALLERGSPPIRICQLGNAGELPEEVVKLRRALMKDKGLRIIPRALQVRIIATAYRILADGNRITCEERILMDSSTYLRTCLTKTRRS
jgi:hypothetical protein